jgi:rhamnose transport system ATP-binding protein
MPAGSPLAPPARLRLNRVSKSFGGIRALTDVSFDVQPGAIHALLGENGAGKSTVVKIVTGIEPPDSGEILIDGVVSRFRSPMEARAAGVVAVYQDPKLFPHLNVAENIFMGIHPLTRAGTVAQRQTVQRAQALLDALDARLDPRQPVLGLSIGEAQFIEIARATAVGEPRLLFLDEPTAALTPAETERLFRLVRRLQSRGASIVFISHRLEELRGFVDAATVLRDGRSVWTRPAAGTSEEEIIRSMVGRPLDQLFVRHRAAAAGGRERLKVARLSSPGAFADVSLTVNAGEVVGLAGLVGAGRTEIAQAIVGLRPPLPARSSSMAVPSGGARRDACSRSASPTCRRTVTASVSSPAMPSGAISRSPFSTGFPGLARCFSARSGNWPGGSRRNSPSKPAISTMRSRPYPAATGRRWFSANGSPPTPACSSSMSRRTAST